MKNIIQFFFLLALLGISFNVQSQVNSKKQNALLWEVTGNGLDKPSYVFGTIHMIDAGDFFWPKNTEKTIEKSDRVVYEIDMKEMENPMTLLTVMMNATMSDGITLKSLLSEEDYNLVKKKVEPMGLPMMIVDRIKPMFLTVMVGQDMSFSGGIGEGIKSYEMEISSLAEKWGKQSGGLESVGFQLSMFDSIPYKEQAEMLSEALRAQGEANDGQEGTIDQLKELVKLYKKQDINGLNKMMREGDETMEKYGHLLLDGRNIAWIPKMEEMMGNESVFFAVGAGHLPGKMGVLELLRQKGYKLSPISN